MKKINYFVLALCLFMFFCITDVYAGSHTIEGSLHTSNSTRNKYKNSINLFEETYNQSNFMNFIYSNGSSFVPELLNKYSITDSDVANGRYTISILSYEDFKYVSSYNVWYYGSSISNNYKSLSGFSDIFSYFFIDDSDYVVRYFDSGYSYTNIDKLVFVGSSDYGNLSIRYYYDDVYLFLDVSYIFLFNSSGDCIGYVATSNYDLSGSGYSNRFFLRFSFPFEDSDSPDITSWYAYAFKLSVGDSSYNNNSYSRVYPEYFYLNSSDKVRVSENAGYSGISGWFKNLFSSYQELSEYNIRFVYDSVFYNQSDKSYINLYDEWLDENSFVIPDNYTTLDISSYAKGYYLVPKTGCSYDDYLLFYSSTTNVSVYGFYMNYYLYSADEDLASLKIYKKFSAFSSKSYVNYSYNPLNDLNVSATDFLNYAINVYPYSTRYSIYLSYNSACYNKNATNVSTSTDLNFAGGTYTLTSTEITSNYNNDTVNGSNYNWGSTSMSGSTSNGNVTNGSIISGEVYTSAGNFSFSDIISNVGNYASSFVDSVSALVGLATIFLVGLPSEIYSILIAIFTIGLVVILIKLIH